MTGLFDAIDTAKAQREDAIKRALREMKGQKLTILEFFICQKGWINQSEAMDRFTEKVAGVPGRWFIGPNYGRRMRELLEDGLLVSELDPDKQDRSHRWRLNR